MVRLFYCMEHLRCSTYEHPRPNDGFYNPLTARFVGRPTKYNAILVNNLRPLAVLVLSDI